MKYCRTKAQFLGCFKHSNASCHHQLRLISLSPPRVLLLRALSPEVNSRMGHSYNIASLLYCLLERTQNFFDIFGGVFVSILPATAHSPVKKPDALSDRAFVDTQVSDFHAVAGRGTGPT